MITNSRPKMSLDWSTLIGLGGQEWQERKPLSSEDDVKRCVRMWTRIGVIGFILNTLYFLSQFYSVSTKGVRIPRNEQVYNVISIQFTYASCSSSWTVRGVA